MRGRLHEDEQVIRAGGEAQQQGNAEKGDAGVERRHDGIVPDGKNLLVRINVMPQAVENSHQYLLLLDALV